MCVRTCVCSVNMSVLGSLTQPSTDRDFFSALIFMTFLLDANKTHNFRCIQSTRSVGALLCAHTDLHRDTAQFIVQ